MLIGAVPDITLIALLSAACIYCAVLSRKLKTLRDGQAELFKTIEKFDLATKRAEKTLALIQSNQAIVGKQLSSLTNEARLAIDELSVMVTSGDHIASRLEQSVSDIRYIGRDHANKKRMAS